MIELKFHKSEQFMREDFPFWIKSITHDARNVPMPHGHEFVELIYVVGGEAYHLFEGDAYEIGAGDVFIINPGEVHSYRVDPGKRLDIINCLFLPGLIQESLLRELKISNSMDYFYVQPFLDKKERFHHRLRLQGEEAGNIHSLLDEMIKEKRETHSGYTTLIRLKLIELLILLSRYYGISKYAASLRTGGGEKEMAIRRICGYLERHSHQKITVASLSGLFNISSRQLNRLFKKETGASVIETIHRIRIARAKQLLADTDEKIITVAALVGYEDPAFFSRLFVREVGCPPGKYRSRKA